MTTPLIIEAAINGPTPKAMNPHVPRTVPEIVSSALACMDAGAAIVHNHNDEGLLDGRHATEPYREAWAAIYARHPEALRSEEHTSELQSHSDLHSFPTRRSSDLDRPQPQRRGPARWTSRDRAVS